MILGQAKKGLYIASQWCYVAPMQGLEQICAFRRILLPLRGHVWDEHAPTASLGRPVRMESAQLSGTYAKIFLLRVKHLEFYRRDSLLGEKRP